MCQMKLTVTFLEAAVFIEDIATHGISDGELALLRRNLARNPMLGEAAPDGHGLRICTIGGKEVVYRPSDDFQRIILLRIRPKDAKPSKLPARIGKAALELGLGIVRKRIEDIFGKEN